VAITVVRPVDRQLQPVGPAGLTPKEQVKLQILRDTEPYVHLAETPPGHVIPPHRHSETEVTVILHGTATVGGETYGPGTVLIVPADEEYGLEAGPAEPLVFAVVRPKKAVFTPAASA
jgi:quercetin dioxygenase-like cupin family protein